MKDTMIETKKTKNAVFQRENGQKEDFALKAPEARTVQLAGDFTQWQRAPLNLVKGSDGVWRTSVALQSGAHQYRFIVDGQWREDPANPAHTPNPFGGQDSVRRVN